MVDNISFLEICFNVLWDGLDACFDWLKTLYASIGLPLIVVVCVFVVISAVFNYVLSPMLKSGASDRASRSSRDKTARSK